MADVLVIDPHPLAAELCASLRRRAELSCGGPVESIAEAAAPLGAAPPSAIVLAQHLRGMDGVEGARLVHALAPRSRIVLLVDDDMDPSLLSEVFAAGVTGVTQRLDADDLIEVVRCAIAGPAFVEGGTAVDLVGGVAARADADAASTAGLTRREREVLQLLGSGRDPSAIAGELGISVHTARGHVKHILAKLEVHSQLEAVVAATRRGLLDQPTTAASSTSS
jgi:DNA-binding NarL/FixJ family response regulator